MPIIATDLMDSPLTLEMYTSGSKYHMSPQIEEGGKEEMESEMGRRGRER